MVDNALLLLLLQSTYFLIPAYFANMAPPIAKKFKFLEFLKVPIEKGKKFSDGKSLFGKNKTYRGYVVGLIGGLIGAYLQMLLYRFPFFQSISISGIDYTSHYIIILLGILLSVGAITGDLVESFFKRRLNKESGESFVPWDQIDHVMGAYLFALPIAFYALTWRLFLCSIILTFFLHVIINHIAFYLHIRKEKW
jgi:CDP-2,3-bis-(O-geranylgeranyl)-sn-glycerol synthase